MEPGEILVRRIFHTLGWINILALCTIAFVVNKKPEWEWLLYANLIFTLVLLAFWFFLLDKND